MIGDSGPEAPPPGVPSRTTLRRGRAMAVNRSQAHDLNGVTYGSAIRNLLSIRLFADAEACKSGDILPQPARFFDNPLEYLPPVESKLGPQWPHGVPLVRSSKQEEGKADRCHDDPERLTWKTIRATLATAMSARACRSVRVIIPICTVTRTSMPTRAAKCPGSPGASTGLL